MTKKINNGSENSESQKKWQIGVKTGHLVPNFGENFFQTPITWLNELFDIFRAQNNHLVISFLMDTEIFEFRPMAAV